ncbi:armadillo-type protein [Pelagophyceae sp. CCMP2097]|nr:armadillo-type protein [Pelagophyceae sp. CCMP2097]
MADIDDVWAAMSGAEAGQRKKAQSKLKALAAKHDAASAAAKPKKKKKSGALCSAVAAVSLDAPGLAAPAAPPPPPQAEAVVETVSAVDLLRKLARAVQQLSDERIATRRQGLETLADVPWASLPEATLAEMLALLSKPLLRRFEDPVERHRELAIDLMTLLITLVDDVIPQLAYLFPVIVARAPQAAVEVDLAMGIFVFDVDQHDAYKRGKAVKRPDLQLAFERERRVTVAEASETLRLKLVELLVTVVRRTHNSPSFGPYIYEVCLLYAGFVRDPFADLLDAALRGVVELCQIPSLQETLVPVATALARVVMPNLRHRHAKVRRSAVHAFHRAVSVVHKAKWRGAGTDAIQDLVGFREDNVIPTASFYTAETSYNYVADLTRDSSDKVRLQLAECLADWFTTLLDRRDHQPRLLAYMLNFAIDESAAVRLVALGGIAVAGKEFAGEHEDMFKERLQYGVDGDHRMNHAAEGLPWPFTERPPLGARLIVRAFAHRMLRPCLDELKNWQSTARRQSAILLRVLFVYCEEHMTQQLHKITVALCKALAALRREGHLADKEFDHRQLILDCCETLGRYIVPESFLPFFAPRVKGDLEVVPDGADSNARGDVMDILGAFIAGAKASTLLPHAHSLIALLTDGAVVDACADESLRRAALRALAALLRKLGDRGKSALEAAFVTTGRLSSLDAAVTAALRALMAFAPYDRCVLSDLAQLDSSPDLDVVGAAPGDEATRFVLRRCAKLVREIVAEGAADDEQSVDLKVLCELAKAVDPAVSKLGKKSLAGLAALLSGAAAFSPRVESAKLLDALAGPVALARGVVAAGDETLRTAIDAVHACAVAAAAAGTLSMDAAADAADVADAPVAAVDASALIVALYRPDTAGSSSYGSADAETLISALAQANAEASQVKRALAYSFEDGLDAAGAILSQCHQNDRRVRPFSKRVNAPSCEACRAARLAFDWAVASCLSKARTSEALRKAAIRLCWDCLFLVSPDADLEYSRFVQGLAAALPRDYLAVPDGVVPDDAHAHLDALLRAAAVLDAGACAQLLRQLDRSNVLDSLVEHAEMISGFAPR